MKITKYVCVDTEIEVDINVEDFLASISGSTDNAFTAIEALNRIASVLKGISKEIIQSLKAEQRKLIFEFLSDQAQRYKEELPATELFPEKTGKVIEEKNS